MEDRMNSKRFGVKCRKRAKHQKEDGPAKR